MDNGGIRQATLTDIETIAPMFDLYRQFYEEESDLTRAAEFLAARQEREESILFLAETSDAEGMGFCQLYPSFCSVELIPIYILYDLFVMPAFRRSGVGRELLLRAEAHARKSGIGRLELSTGKTNYPAQTLYEALGWVRDEQFFTYSRYPAV